MQAAVRAKMPRIQAFFGSFWAAGRYVDCIKDNVQIDNQFKYATNINPYLLNAPSVLIENRSKPLSEHIPQIVYGSMPIDDGHLILEKEDYDALLAENPNNEKFIRKSAGGAELIRN